MAEQGSFWRRFGGMFRSERGAPPRSVGGSATPVVDEMPQRGAAHKSPLALGSDAAPVPWWRRRQAKQAQAREMSLRVMELAGAMQQHFHRQDARAAELAGALDRVGGTLQQLAEAQRTQGECLANIATHAETTSKHTAQMTETFGRLPDSLVTQAEAIRAVARQLEVSQESDTQLMHSLQHFGRAVDTLSTSGTAQVEVLQQLTTAQRQQHDTLAALVREQSRRQLMIMIVAAVLTLMGLAALVTGAALYVSRSS